MFLAVKLHFNLIGVNIVHSGDIIGHMPTLDDKVMAHSPLSAPALSAAGGATRWT